MNRTASISPTRISKKKFITALLIGGSLAAFATLGDGTGTKSSYSKSLLSYKPVYNYKHFTLKSGYNYRGSHIFSPKTSKENYIILNKVITYQKGNTTYILPLKRKVLLDKIRFNPSPSRF
ncbi:MAG: hypothetical protein ABR503_00225 [Chitinophagaceae bacterium]